jgi:hypothetical protein
MRARLVFQTLYVLMFICIGAHQGSAACLNPPANPQVISQFKANPQGLVGPDSDTRTVEAMVRDLAGTDASLAVDLVQVAHGVAPRFRTAIAAGLAQAAVACGTVDQQAGLAIQQAVASFKDGQFQASFAAVAGDLSTAATDAANSSANGSVGSVVVTNPGSGRGATTNSGGGGGGGAPGQLTSSGIISNSAAITRNTVGTNSALATAATPVSPTR